MTYVQQKLLETAMQGYSQTAIGKAGRFLEKVCDGGIPSAAGEQYSLGPEDTSRYLEYIVCVPGDDKNEILTAVQVSANGRKTSLKELRKGNSTADAYPTEFTDYAARRAHLDSDFSVLLCLRYIVLPLQAGDIAPALKELAKWLIQCGHLEETGEALIVLNKALPKVITENELVATLRSGMLKLKMRSDRWLSESGGPTEFAKYTNYLHSNGGNICLSEFRKTETAAAVSPPHTRPATDGLGRLRGRLLL